MKGKQNRVRRADVLRGTMGAVMVLMAMLAQAKPGPTLPVLALFALLAFLAVEFFMNRCPHCDRYLDRNWGQFCQHCGQRIRGRETDT